VTGYFVRRILALIPVALGVTTLTFALIHLVPGDPVIAMLGDNASPTDIVGLRHAMGLDRPLGIQYLAFLNGLAHGDLGQSISAHAPVATLILEHFPATLELAGAGLLTAILLAFPLGIIAGVNPGGAADLGAMGFAILGISIPHIYLGPLLMIVLSLDLGWLPLTGRGGLAHLVLPAITLALVNLALYVRLTRASMLEVLTFDYVRTARAKGLADRAVLVRHALRNALLPVVTVTGVDLGRMVGGAVLTETVFAWPGVGTLMYTALQTRDYPVIVGSFMLVSVAVLLANLLVDILYAVLDPRIQYR